jgi:Zn-dependent M28 family amino/carboxypeptidase
VRFLAASAPARAFHNVAVLNRAADHVEAEFRKAGCEPERQTFQVGGDDYHNIICSFGPADAPRVVIGAHYDVAGDDNPGADDNASAVAGVLELARLLEQEKPDLPHRLDLVAFSLEEPPNFQSATMGSYVHAKSLAGMQAEIKLMISVEMIDYFSDAPGSQTYPLPLLNLIYPDKGDFIGVIGRSFDRSLVARVKTLMRVSDALPVHSINAPALVPGIDLSDHWSYWQHGLPALMVSDTAFLRNPNYHMASDTADTLDYRRMALTVDGLYRVAVGF